MSKSIKESKYGSLVITTDDTFERNKDIDKDIDKNIVFLMKDKSIQKGVIRMSGKFNNCLYVYGIEIDNSIQFCVDDIFKKSNNIQYRYMIFMEQSLNFVEIDKENNFVVNDKIEGDADGSYEKGTLVLVRFKHTYKAAIIERAGTINGLFCYEIKLHEKFCGKNSYTMLEVDIVSKLLNDRGFILVQDNLELIPDDDVHSVKIGNEYEHEPYKGTVKWKGRVNGLACVGLKTDDGEVDDFTKFSKQKNSFWSIIPVDQSCANPRNTSTLHEIKIDDGLFTDKVVMASKIDNEIQDNLLIAFRIKEIALKGNIVWYGYVNNNVEVYGIKTNLKIQNGTNGTFNQSYIFSCTPGCGILLRRGIKFLELNQDGTVKNKTKDDMLERRTELSPAKYVSVKIDNKIIYGTNKYVGEINGILCYEVEIKGGRMFNRKWGDSIIVIENDIFKNEIMNPADHNLYTYFKIGAYVEIGKGRFGAIKKYVLAAETFHYLVEIDNELSIENVENVKYGLDLDFNDKAFLTVDNLQNYATYSSFKLGSAVEIKISKSIYPGHISWMGFDKDKNFKFGITLEKAVGDGNGHYYNQTLFKTEKNGGKLVSSSEVYPDSRFSHEEKRKIEPSKKSMNETQYQPPRYKINSGDFQGIQGNLNSCYLDTSLFAIFTFNVYLDNLILEENDKTDIKNLQDILKNNIVYPLRKYQYVSFDKVAEFRKQLQVLCPDGKFLINERDPEELLEALFHLLTPKRFLLKTKLLSDDNYEQKCFLTQLFYQIYPKKKELTVLEMLALTFLESHMLISQPPKALILQLPRHGRELKKFETVKISPKIDITPFIVISSKICKNCSKVCDKAYICETCSMDTYELTYYCESHKEVCKHEKKSVNSNSTSFKGRIILELTAILCIEKTHYIAYVKTNEVTEKWIYFNSMEALENGELIPNVRETMLHQYFQGGNEKYSENLKWDVDKIEHYAFVCFYKNPAMEFYSEDMNSVKKI